jgi:phytoene dehydrogenase-like protein
MEYDVIIIGAGHNGLVCGAYLAKGGLKVIVLEREDIVGGCVKTKDLPNAPGFKWDVFGNAHLFITGNPLLRNKEIPLERYGLKYIPVDKPFGTPFPDGDSIVLHSELKNTLDSLRKHSSEDAIAFENLYNLYIKVKDEILTFFFSSPSKIETFLKFRSLSKKLGGKEGILELIRTISLSPRVFVEEHFKNNKVRAWLAPWGLHPDYGPDVNFGSSFAFLSATIQQEFGGLVPEGGSGMLSNALAEYIRDKGGEIRTDSTVDRIILKNGRVEGVRIEGGDTIEAKKAIITCIEPKMLFLKLIGEENLPSDFIVKVKRYRYGIAGMKLDFALNEPIKWKAGEDINKTLHYI